MSHIFLNIGPEDMIGRDYESYFPVWWGQNRANHSFPLFVLLRKLIYSIKYVVYDIRRQNVFMYL